MKMIPITMIKVDLNQFIIYIIILDKIIIYNICCEIALKIIINNIKTIK